MKKAQHRVRVTCVTIWSGAPSAASATKSARSRRWGEHKTLHPLLVDFLSYCREYDGAPRRAAEDRHGLQGRQVAANADLAP